LAPGPCCGARLPGTDRTSVGRSDLASAPAHADPGVVRPRWCTRCPRAWSTGRPDDPRTGQLPGPVQPWIQPQLGIGRRDRRIAHVHIRASTTPPACRVTKHTRHPVSRSTGSPRPSRSMAAGPPAAGFPRQIHEERSGRGGTDVTDAGDGDALRRVECHPWVVRRSGKDQLGGRSAWRPHSVRSAG